jgi:S-(hydroxymethyl)glutathione dehydrogenase / alcohol dehydrogenase
MKTRAAILVELRKDLVLDEIEVPALQAGQVLVKILATRICGSQIGEIDGVKGEDKYLPHLLGHEAAGTVLEIGPAVTHVKAGDRVVCHWRPGRGVAIGGSKYSWRGQTVNAGHITTFQDTAIIAENRLTVVPADTDPEICCLLADTITTGFGVINHNAQVKIGESVVVVGVGGIGLGTILGARLAGAHPIIAVDKFDHKLKRARATGATHAINVATEDFAVAAEKILRGKADVVVDGTGRPEVLEKLFALAGPQGRCVGVGVMPHDLKLTLNTLPLHMGKVLTGSHGGESQPALEIPRYLRMIREGRIDLSGFVSHRCSLDEINDGIARMRSGESIHTIVNL